MKTPEHIYQPACARCRDEAGKDRAGVTDTSLCNWHTNDLVLSLRAEVERLEKALRESQETLALVLWAHTRGRVTVFDHHRVTLPIPWEIVTYLDVDTRATVIGARAAIAAEEEK